MAAMGEVTVAVKVDASRVLVVLQAMDMMALLLDRYGHTWTKDERAMVERAVEACDRRNLTAESI